MLRRLLRSSGLEMKSNAPSLSACTAVSTLPCAVMTATGTPGVLLCIHSTSSRPSPSGRRMSVRHRSKIAFAEQFLGARDVRGRLRLDVHAAERERQQLADVGFVIDDQCQRFLHSCGRSSCASQRSGSANTMRKMLPPPGRSRYSSVARFSSHSSREMYRPRPVPPERSVKNGSKILSAVAGSTP